MFLLISKKRELRENTLDSLWLTVARLQVYRVEENVHTLFERIPSDSVHSVVPMHATATSA